MTDPITIHVLIRDGEPLIDNQCLALLLGVEVEALRGLPIQNGSTSVPADWVKRGRRRAREAQAHTGSTAMLDSLRYWAMRDHGATLEVIYQ